MPLETLTYKDGAGASQDTVADLLPAGGHAPAGKILIAADGVGAGTDLLSDARPMPTVTVYGAENHAVLTVGTSAVAVPTTALSGRRRIQVQARLSNTGLIVLGFSAGVTVANGFVELGAGGAWAEMIGPGLSVFAISDTAGQSIRFLELAT